ncbi:ComF family protein [Chitinilyticum litopenaei]|uniref:ComF family protein n=1 Tax=Chitinilyticum litopenaei TaxID=1121276 RepID=UPI0003F74124|nr:ComF family protein [Chitinilyticum litopenaei]
MPPGFLNKLFARLPAADRLLPCRCLLCAGSSKEALCPACLAALPWLDRRCCPRCALPTPAGGLCGGCLARPPRFDACHALFAYQPPLSPLILAGKYGGRWPLWALLGHVLAGHRPALAGPALLLPMPLYPGRLRERGFNQAAELARALAQQTGLPLRHDLLARVRDTGHQSRLSRKARARNLRQAFRVNGQLAGETVIVVDDVLTSGATLDAAARALKRAGAGLVIGWVLARTLRH